MNNQTNRELITRTVGIGGAFVLPTIGLEQVAPWAHAQVIWRSTVALLVPPSSALVFRNGLVTAIPVGIFPHNPQTVSVSAAPNHIKIMRMPSEEPRILVCIEGKADRPYGGVCGLVQALGKKRDQTSYLAFFLDVDAERSRYTKTYDNPRDAIDHLVSLAN